LNLIEKDGVWGEFDLNFGYFTSEKKEFKDKERYLEVLEVGFRLIVLIY
jgi:hypothetical protein